MKPVSTLKKLDRTDGPSRLGRPLSFVRVHQVHPKKLPCIRMTFNFDINESISYVRKQGMVMSNSCIDQSFGINQI